jgi:hypothetical protein
MIMLSMVLKSKLCQIYRRENKNLLHFSVKFNMYCVYNCHNIFLIASYPTAFSIIPLFLLLLLIQKASNPQLPVVRINEVLLYICNLFNDGVSSSDCNLLNYGRNTGMNWTHMKGGFCL